MNVSLARRITLVLTLSLLMSGPALAFVVRFVPASQTVSLGGTVSVDILVSGLHDPTPDEIVSGFDFDVLYDSTILSATGVSFATGLGGPLDSFQAFDLSVAGSIDLAEFSFLDDLTLDALQGDSVTLATLSFTTLALGSSELLIEEDADFVLTGRADAGGIPQPLAPLTVQSGSINVQPVPSPATLGLLALGLVMLLRPSWRASRRLQP